MNEEVSRFWVKLSTKETAMGAEALPRANWPRGVKVGLVWARGSSRGSPRRWLGTRRLPPAERGLCCGSQARWAARGWGARTWGRQGAEMGAGTVRVLSRVLGTKAQH